MLLEPDRVKKLHRFSDLTSVALVAVFRFGLLVEDMLNVLAEIIDCLQVVSKLVEV